MSFQVGEEIICIEVPPRITDGPDEPWMPQMNCVYHVSGVDESIDDEEIIDLAEDPFPVEEGAWPAKHFRKLRPYETEAREQWQEMLRNPQRIDA